MAIELPSNPDALAERLALLEDPVLAERLARENPSLFTVAPPQTEREVLAWTTRRFGTALIAVTAAIAVAAGYVGNELRRNVTTARQSTAPHAAVAAVPVASRHIAAAPRHPAATHHAAAPAHHPAPAAHHASDAHPAFSSTVGGHPTVVHSTVAHPTVVRHYAAPVVAYPVSSRTASATHDAVAVPVARPAAHHASAPVTVHHTAPATAPRTAQTADEQLAAWSATHPASRTRPRSEPRSSTEPATATSSSTRTATAPSTGPESYPTSSTPRDGSASSGVPRTPPSNPNGGWTERIPSGVLGGAMGPILGVPRDSCTPRGGRVGIVMEAIQMLAAGRH